MGKDKAGTKELHVVLYKDEVDEEYSVRNELM